MAVHLSQEWQQALTNAFVDGYPIVWSSVDADGQPVLNFFGTTQAYSDHEVALWMRTPDRGFLARIAENPRVAMIYRNHSTRFGFQLHGEARRVEDDAIRRHVYDASPEAERNADPEMQGLVVIVEVTRAIARGQVVMERD